MRLIPASVALAILFSSQAVHAQGLDDGTVDVYFQKITRQGELEGCSLVFTTVGRDHAYKRGAQVVMNGSIAFRTLGGAQFLFAGKLGTRLWTAQGPGKWESPNHFHFATKSGNTAQAGKIAESDTEGYKLLLADASEPSMLKLLEEMMDSGELTVGFNRQQGGQDVSAPIKINVALQRRADGTVEKIINQQTALDFYGCIDGLVAGLQRKLGK